jgi:hypothetical protein
MIVPKALIFNSTMQGLGIKNQNHFLSELYFFCCEHAHLDQ